MVEEALSGLPLPPPGVTDIRMGLTYDEEGLPDLHLLEWSVDQGGHWKGEMSRGPLGRDEEVTG